jgi:acetolactate synthase-1/2/3 large subunit
LATGVFGYAGHESARAALADPALGLILGVGTALGQWTTSNWDKALLNGKLVHIHPVVEYFSRSPMARLHVQGEVKAVFELLAERAEAWPSATKRPLPERRISANGAPAQIEIRDAADYRSEAEPIHPQRLVAELMSRLPPETRFLVDTSCWLPWTLHYLFSPQPQNYRRSSELAAMGWGIGAAVGTALGNPDAPVVGLTGDGCYLMFGQEVAVAVAERLPVVFIILNDAGYGMVKHRHRQITPDALEFDLSPVDFSLMAQAVGANGIVIRQIEDWTRLDFAALFQRNGPTVLDVRIDPEATPPTGMF